MNIDIRTLIFVIGFMHIIQVVVFIHQYLINKTYRGIGWWLLWSVAEVIGFIFMLLRTAPLLHSVAIIGQNAMIVLGVIFLYVGILRFLDRKVNLGILVPVYAGYVAALMFFLHVHDDIQVRGVIISVALAGFSFLSAWALFVNKPRAISASANFVAAVLMIHGSFFAYRTVALTIGVRADNFFAPTMFNVAMFMDALVVAILWTFGFIIMINQRLNAEATEAKEHFELIFNTSPDAALITRLKDGLILGINEGFTTLTGHTREEAIGKSSLEVNIWEHPADRQKVVDELLEKGFCENFESIFRTKTGDRIIGMMSAKTITLMGLPHIISVTRDITERTQAEDRIKALLGEKELLLKEVHHRIKNNMSSMMSLLSLQSNALKNPEAAEALREARDRMRSMGVLYDKLYRSENLREMSLKNYLPALVDEIVAVFPNKDLVKIGKRIEDVILGVKVLSPLGIIVNELITNAMKYAFTGREGGSISVSASAKNDRVTLIIEDDGNGIPESVDIANSDGFGLQIVNMLTAQLDGTLRVEREKGTRFVLEFDA